MEIEDLKKAWKQVNQNQTVSYTVDEIGQFRKARSKDFSSWIRSSMLTDFMLKGIITVSFVVLAFLFSHQIVVQLIAAGLSILSGILILFEIPYFNRHKQLDLNPEHLQAALIAKLNYLKAYYFKVQFLVGLSNPLLVLSGILFYTYFKYGEVRPLDLEDAIVFGVILIVAYLFTIPTTAGLYGFHLRNLQNSLAQMEDEGHWKTEMSRYKKSRTIVSIIFLALLAFGIAALVLILLL